MVGIDNGESCGKQRSADAAALGVRMDAEGLADTRPAPQETPAPGQRRIVRIAGRCEERPGQLAAEPASCVPCVARSVETGQVVATVRHQRGHCPDTRPEGRRRPRRPGRRRSGTGGGPDGVPAGWGTRPERLGSVVAGRQHRACRRSVVGAERPDPSICHVRLPSGASVAARRYHNSRSGTPMRVGSVQAAIRARPSTETTNVAVTKAMQAPPWP
jgi:hypothetical protein